MSGALPGEWILDPFCGTGGTLIEAALIGCREAGTDADLEMIAGSRKNLLPPWPLLQMPAIFHSLINPSIMLYLIFPTVSRLPL
jgi:hypothetical protein